jgi:hypothetical protein
LLSQRSRTGTNNKHHHKRCNRQNLPLILKHDRSSSRK